MQSIAKEEHHRYLLPNLQAPAETKSAMYTSVMNCWEMVGAISELYKPYELEQNDIYAPPTHRTLGDFSQVFSFLTTQDIRHGAASISSKQIMPFNQHREAINHVTFIQLDFHHESSFEAGSDDVNRCRDRGRLSKRPKKKKPNRPSAKRNREIAVKLDSTDPEPESASRGRKSAKVTFATNGLESDKENGDTAKVPVTSAVTTSILASHKAVSEVQTVGFLGNLPLILHTKSDRDFELRRQLLHIFAEDEAQLTLPIESANYQYNPAGIHVFIDFSNIQIGYLEHMEALLQRYKVALGDHHFQHWAQVRAPPLSFDSLVQVLERNRPAAKRVLVGSTPEPAAVKDAAAMGYECNILEKVFKVSKKEPYKGRTHAEQGVDEILQLKISQSIIDTLIQGQQPSTIVLATGDGAEAEYSDGFRVMVHRALACGWRVEIVAWRKSISYGYSKLQKRWPDRFRIIELDPYAELLVAGP